MKRPTITDLARESGVSTSTVNRILSGAGTVKGTTAQRVHAAAERIGFYGLGAIEDQIRKSAPHYRFGFLLQQSTRELYQMFAREIRQACRLRPLDVVDPLVDFVDLLTPENFSNRLYSLGQHCDAVAIIAPDHPQISQTIRALNEIGKPVITYITDQSAPERAAFVGTDNWRVGRTAAWFIHNMSPVPGKLVIFQGNPRYQCQDVADASFRSYFREIAPEFMIEESQTTHEEPLQAYEITRDLLKSSEDLVGIFIVGGGISGVLRAIREIPQTRQSQIRLVCRDIGPETRKGLSEGLITAALCHPLKATPEALVQTMIDAVEQKGRATTVQCTVPFDIVTPESI
ncbi:LacI family DNA-binding transcriptional regulator [Thioclava sp. SK-1]|uniref:LacI family DNA-binding transcriptional regulator n=1 Tax=Thioclava sp. SK-1 TaxID=1889770 RepID=UPI000A457AE6|nr:LacI family DNA-binding transcriptional regulator [Thioclava sp. SK-1]